MPNGLHHLELYVSDINRSIEFWEWLLKDLGYELFQKWEDGRSYKIDDTYIVFVQAERRFLDIPYHRCRVGLNHLAFHAKSKNHVDELLVKLQDKNATLLYANRYPHAGGNQHYAVYFEDPDRIKVEIVASD